MEASFELPIQSPTGERIVIDRTASAYPPLRPPSPPEAPSLSQLRAAHSRSSTSPKRLPGSSSARAKAVAGRLHGAREGETGSVTYSGGSLRELKLRRMTQPRESDRVGTRLTIARPKKRTSPTAIPKSLLPATERKSQEENKIDRLSKKEPVDGGDKWDIAPDGSSAGREGRQFTVANVGNNGRIYLRPTVRPVHLRSPQPNFVFPMTPPGTAGLDVLMQDQDKRSDQLHRPQQEMQQNQKEQRHEIQRQPLRLETTSKLFGSDWTPDQPSSPTALPVQGPLLFNSNNSSRSVVPRPSTAGAVAVRPGGGHRRAISDSTVQDTSIARESEPGGFKIVITQPADDKQRAKTLEDLAPTHPNASVPHLEIAIPTWKLGSPRFTLRGTPVLRGSSYAPTDEPHSSRPSYFSPAFDHSHSLLEEDSLVSPRQDIFERQKGKAQGLPSPLGSPRFLVDEQPVGLRPAYHSNYAMSVPEMFDSLTFKPACDDRTIVRFSPVTNTITAATPPRLVAEITSPKFMDYDLVSDFFLTYRAFLDARDLLRMLVARLRWAVERSDEVGMVVRVRTFVALRHWILNYFMDDFVIDYELRVLFCELLNGFVNELSQDASGRKVQLKILTELKKCWRRSCAQYWDGPDFDDSLGPEVPISQGGTAGHRNPTLDPSFWEQVAVGALPDEEDDEDGSDFLTHFQSPESMVQPEPGSSFRATGDQAAHIDSVVLGDRPATPENRESTNDFSARRQASPASITSLDIVSCSFPTKNIRLLQAGIGQPLGAHPAEPSLVYSASGLVATTPRALVGKRVRPSDGQKSSGHIQQHKRNNSLTDSLREQSTMDKLLQKNNEILMSLPYAGSLVRGAIFPPGQPYVEVLPPGTSGGVGRQTTLFQPYALEPPDSQKLKASAMSSPGMRKLLGSVRRALSTRGQAIPSTQGNFINMAPIGPRGATTNRLPGTAIVPQARPRINGFRPPIRIDLLGAKIAEDFKVAVREDASLDAAAAQPGGDASNETRAVPDTHAQRQPEPKVAASAYSDSLFLGWTPGGVDNLVRPISDTGITTGSKSIVIVDGTLPLEFPVMTGALAQPNSNNASVELFGESFLSVAADPTPPTTPPGQPMGTPRPSSFALGEQVVRSSLSMDPLPPFVPDMDTLGHSSNVGPSGLLVEDTSARPPLGVDVLQHEPEDSIIVPQRPGEDGVDEASSEVQVAVVMNKNPATNSFGLSSSPPIRRPQPSWIQGHSRHRSNRSYKSHKSSRSYRRGRLASYASGTAPPTGILSFNASTYTDASVDDASETQAPQPPRVLRRRPGGDLRAVTTVGDLDQGPIRRSRSVGSLTTYSESIRSSFVHSRARESGGFVDVISVDFTRDKEETFSVGMMTDKKKLKKRMSMFSTYSSKPVMRPSFEAEAQKLAQIPDDVDDDGGVESALLKLEGKFERKSKKLSFSEPPSKVFSPTTLTKGTAAPPLSGFLAPQDASDSNRLTAEEKTDHRHRQIVHSDLAPSHQSLLSKSAQQSTVAATELDAIESQYGGGTDEPRSSSMATSSHIPAFSPPPAFRPAAVPRMVEDVQSFLSESGESYSSIPLLDRGLTDDGRSKGAPTEEWANQSIFEEANEGSVQTPTGRSSGHLVHQDSYEVVEKTESIEKIPPGETMPQSPGQGTDVSFLEDESDHASDLSSELSVEFPDETDELGIYGPSTTQGPVRSNTVVSRMPAHPIGDPQIEPSQTPSIPFQEQHPGKLVEDIHIHDGHPPSPPITLVQALQMSPDTAKIPELHDFQVWEDKPLPPTPSPDGAAPETLRSKKQAEEAEVLSSMGLRFVFEPSPAQLTAKAEAARAFSVHLPFILAFESEILAQQFTLIEKDALHEIDWKELIEMRWKNAENGNSRSWVDFLRNSDARGVEVVVARFNIMVKWAISEVILTQDLEERARCLIKFIHIAAHCRRYRNYATMSQITIALTSNEVGRLARTWAMIPPCDARTLRDLEALVSPTRNFYGLRAEMEAVGIDNADAGCIPFVGIYTHDLLFNAQRPSEIASSPTTPPLVNFERCRFAASIVKTVLRLVEASALYNFQPIEGITERCLWMSALSDDDIRKYSDALE
ncbi:RasGEF group protein [Sporothrix schenckii 1099-18]|uniref:RasGEF group protein n=1 Tax=Sporothrix schenckii 1099-18 TaxID=1397361 RepID=A0A0F2LZG1_SPOSC|nr:RasGEF group protein [Sporothrix schenckii 1099-18]KJR81286.1 RasGEF group protein [Sporothrix schenckii 1099-18]